MNICVQVCSVCICACTHVCMCVHVCAHVPQAGRRERNACAQSQRHAPLNTGAPASVGTAPGTGYFFSQKVHCHHHLSFELGLCVQRNMKKEKELLSMMTVIPQLPPLLCATEKCPRWSGIQSNPYSGWVWQLSLHEDLLGILARHGPQETVTSPL